MESSRCVRNCLECYGKEAGEDGECKAPKEIKSNNKFFCDRKGTTVDNCNDCKDPSDGDIEFTIGNATTHRCDINKAKFGNDDAVMKKELQSKGKFHCVIGEVDKYVDDCTMDCHAIDDQFGEIKKRVSVGDNCEMESLDLCKKLGMVYCDNGMEKDESGNSVGVCKPSCANCFKASKLDANMPGQMKMEPKGFNVSFVCESEEQAKVAVKQKSSNNLFCTATQKAVSSCNECVDSMGTVFGIESNKECKLACGDAVREIKYSSWSDNYQTPKTFCPITKQCLDPVDWPFNVPGDGPVDGTQGYPPMAMPGNPCEACVDPRPGSTEKFNVPKYNMETYSMECSKPSPESCMNNGGYYCPSSEECIMPDYSTMMNFDSTKPPQQDSVCMKCPGYPLMSADGSGSCAAKAKITATIPSGEAYCQDAYYAYFTTDCSMCNMDGIEKVKDKDNMCSPKAAAPKVMVTKKVVPKMNMPNVTAAMSKDPADKKNMMKVKTFSQKYDEAVEKNGGKPINTTEGMEDLFTPENKTAPKVMIHKEEPSVYCPEFLKLVADCTKCGRNTMLVNGDCVKPAYIRGCRDSSALNFDMYATDGDDATECSYLDSMNETKVLGHSYNVTDFPKQSMNATGLRL
jgi:hypothetical protein